MMMMDQEQIVAAVSSSTVEVFRTMLGLEVSMGPSRTELNPPGPSAGIIAVTGLAGAWMGTTSLSCDAAMACRISSKMVGEEYGEVNEEVLDAISEIANMIFGNFKTRAEAYLGPLGLSIPTVIYGLSFSARSAGRERWIVVPCTCGDNSVELKVCLTPNRGLFHTGKH
jgi:chemotaxis protein CheX